MRKVCQRLLLIFFVLICVQIVASLYFIKPVAAEETYLLTVNTIGNGSFHLNNTGPYNLGDIVELTAVPDTGWSFSGWSGSLSGSVNPSTLLIDGNKTVTATFIQNVYSLTVSTVGSGSVSKNPDQASYHYGDVVQLTATPTAGYSFSGWSGALSGSANPASLTITGDKSVTATFTQNQYTLTVNTQGSGSVSKDPDQASYASGTTVTLTATPNAGWTFSGWSGNVVSSQVSIQVTMDNAKSITATFTQNQYTLTVNTLGSGSVSLNNSGPYHYGDVVNLTATPGIGYGFAGWGGDLSGLTNPGTIIINGNKVVTATFSQSAYSLTVNSGVGGTVSLNNSGPYHYGDVVNLTATPSVGWSFSGWSGNLSGSVNPTTLLIDGNKVVNATFAQNAYSLTVNSGVGGSIGLNNTGPYRYGDVVKLTATPSAGYSFAGWSGALSGSTNPGTIIINGNKVVNATFSQTTCSLTINIVGNGFVSLNNSGPYRYGDVVKLIATPIGGSFSGWSGSLSGSTNPVYIIINGTTTVTATFTQNGSPQNGSPQNGSPQNGSPQNGSGQTAEPPAIGTNFQNLIGSFSDLVNGVLYNLGIQSNGAASTDIIAAGTLFFNNIISLIESIIKMISDFLTSLFSF